MTKKILLKDLLVIFFDTLKTDDVFSGQLFAVTVTVSHGLEPQTRFSYISISEVMPNPRYLEFLSKFQVFYPKLRFLSKTKIF